MDLVKLIGSTYYISNRTNIGVFKLNLKDVCLIDTGNDKDAGKKILKILNEENLNVKYIINTHSHADHIGGNKIIKKRCDCEILASDGEKCFINNPLFEPTFLYGSKIFRELDNKFLRANESDCQSLKEINGLEYISLKGHSYNMIGVKTKDNVYFLGDALVSEETINKYHLFFLYDVREYLNTLDYLETLEGKFYIPAHTQVVANLFPLININRNKIKEICDVILNICDGKNIDNIVKEVFKFYQLKMNCNQYFLVSSTIKAYLTYLLEEEKIKYEFINNEMLWFKIN